MLRSVDIHLRMGENWENHSSSTQGMPEEQLKAFLEAVKANGRLQEKLNAAEDANAVVKIAKEAGFVISADELEMSKELIEDEELERVAGGRGGLTFMTKCQEAASVWRNAQTGECGA